MTKIGFIGTGNMGTAIIKGIAGSTLSSEVELFATDIDNKKLESLAQYGVSALADAKEICRECKYVFLAIKPQMFEEVLEIIAPCVNEDTVLVSIAAGITGEYIQSKTIPNAKVTLVMPNTPLLLGEGATALAKVSPITNEEFDLVCRIFASCGETAVISKEKMKEIIAINGSSPAFIYLFAKGFIDYAKEQGIDEGVAKTLFSKTLVGSAKMITDSGFSIDELIKMVSSPGGTTLKGLDALYEGNLLQVVKNSCEACTARAYELSK